MMHQSGGAPVEMFCSPAEVRMTNCYGREIFEIRSGLILRLQKQRACHSRMEEPYVLDSVSVWPRH
jgi:hypothetical protein